MIFINRSRNYCRSPNILHIPMATVQLPQQGGTPTTTTAVSWMCNPGELLTGFTVLDDPTNNPDYDIVNSVANPQCTNFNTMVTRDATSASNTWVGWTNAGRRTTMQCPAGSY